MTKSTKTPKTKNIIEANRVEISNALSGVDTTKRLNNLNWVRHELSYTEPRSLFFAPAKEQKIMLDYNNMKNIGEAYDYIVENPTTHIDATEIYKIHSILCYGTNITGGIQRRTDKVLELTVNGARYHAPDQSEITSRLSDIVFSLNDPSKDTLTRAFEAHYELIALQPFDDFNKRTARLIMNWILIQGGYRPIIFNKPSDKQKYRNAIAAMTNGNRKEYMTYMSEMLLRSQRELIKQLRKSRI